MPNKELLLQKIQDDIKEYCNQCYHFSFNENDPHVRLHEPTTNAEEVFAAVSTILSTYTTMGKKVRAFEQEYADYMGIRHGVMSNSGSSANLLAVAALANPVTENGLKPSDEVLVSALSWSTTVWPIIQNNLIPVLVDCNLSDLNIDIEKLEKAVGPKTRAIKIVHVYGNPCNMDAIMAFAKKHNLIVIEDCCEAMGAEYDGKSVGSFGRVGTFSFFFSHHISTLEGGITVTNDFDLTETMRILRAHGWSREADEHQKYAEKYSDIDPRFIFINLGYNLRPTEVNAAMGQLQLPKLDHFIEERRNVAEFYLTNLDKYAEFFHFQKETPKAKHVWFGFPIIVKDNAPFTVKDMTTFLQSRRIETRPIIAGNLARHPAFALYKHRIGGDLSSSDKVMHHGFAIACHQAVDENARKYVLQAFDEFMQNISNQKEANLISHGVIS